MTDHLERVTSQREIRKVITDPSIFRFQDNGFDHPDDYVVNPRHIFYRVGKGLVIYIPRGVCVELHTALFPGDLPDRPIEKLHEQWAELAGEGFHTVYSYVDAGHFRACYMCRAAGMERVDTDGTYNMFKKVIYEQRRRCG